MTRVERAQQVWRLLVYAAKGRKTYTYEELAFALGMKAGAARAMWQFLHPIMCYCNTKRIPPLTVLVVNKSTRRPGLGLTTLDDVNRDRDRVFSHDWFRMECPEVGDFEEAVRDSSP